ncbi:hypothetical protein QUC31_002843 [Theobroma cacao]
MMMMDQLTHRGLARLAQKNGGIFHLNMGFLHVVAISNPEMARQMRKLCVMKLFSRKKAESWESVRDEVESLVKAV